MEDLEAMSGETSLARATVPVGVVAQTKPLETTLNRSEWSLVSCQNSGLVIFSPRAQEDSICVSLNGFQALQDSREECEFVEDEEDEEDEVEETMEYSKSEAIAHGEGVAGNISAQQGQRIETADSKLEGSGTCSISASEGSKAKPKSFLPEALMSSIFAWNMRGFNKPRKQRLCRIWVCWSDDVEVCPVSVSAQMITVWVRYKASRDTFLSSFIYASNCMIERRELWSEIEAIAGSVAGTNNSWIIQGDFNVALSAQEHSRAVESAMDRISMRDFQNVVYKCDMMDLAQVGPSFTWSNSQEANPISKKLDPVMVNNCWINEFPNSFVTFEAGGVSDHLRMHIQLRAAIQGNLKPFKFFNHTASRPRFLEVVAMVWNKTEALFHSRFALRRFQDKLKALKSEMRGLNRDMFGDLPGRVKLAYDDLCMKQTEAMQNPQASTFEEASDAWEHWHHSAQAVLPDVLQGLIDYRCSPADAVNLTRPVEAAEITEILFSMPANKAPGPDGYPMEFYKAAWPVIGKDLITEIQSFFLFGFMPHSINATLLSLVPKTTEAEKMTDFRPIACCNGRLLLENVLLATELVKDYHKDSVSSRSAIKLDISKAFDTVSWSLIEDTLRAMEYSDMFVSWIMKCISTAAFSVSVNGELEGFFISSRGIRQGCSLSPYLYVIVSNVLSKLINKSVVEGQIGFHSQCREVNLSHLSFVDDIVVFTDGSPASLVGTLQVFDEFASMSGLRINVTKSTVSAAGRGRRALEEAATISGLPVLTLPIKYLGLPLTTKIMTRNDYEPLTTKIRNHCSHRLVKLSRMLAGSCSSSQS
ncbi:PREDICTED: uncharacterized protein LOC106297206 [Brassica oleracea var. oleracea]|nr:PREDICTED: uncharacterized protein LOC106297206 [Brassica oleracea var. oleracea]